MIMSAVFRPVTCHIMSMICICVYPAPATRYPPVDRNAARVKFTGILAFCQCRGTKMKSVVTCSTAFVTISNPAGGTVGVSQSYCYRTNGMHIRLLSTEKNRGKETSYS